MTEESAALEPLETGETLGQFLRRERTSRGVSLREVSDVTKINIRMLEALEEDNLEALPPRAILKGFLRAYALCLRINPEEVMLLFEGEVSSPQPEKAQPVQETKLDDDDALKRTLLLVFAGIIAASLFYAVFIRDWSPKLRRAPSDESSITQQSGGVGPEAPAPAVEGRPTAEAPPSEGSMVLEIVAVEETWVRVVRDEVETSASLMRAGESRRWHARDRFVLTIGNVAGSRLSLNGRPVELPRSTTNVVHNLVLSAEQASAAVQ